MTSRAPEQMTVVVGYGNYGEVNALNRYLDGSVVSIVSAGPDLQDVFDAVAQYEPTAVLLNPEVRRYAPDFIDQLLFREEGPIPVIGYVMNDTTGQGALMRKAGAVRFFELAKLQTGTELVTQIASAYERVLADREAGQHHLTADIPAAPVGALMQRVIVPWLPKGGGSARTTTAVNVACCLAALGNPVCLLDFDQTKGDIHTVLGYTADHTSPLTPRFPVVDRGLFDLVMSLVHNGFQAGDSIPFNMLHQYLFVWDGDPSVGKNLHFMPGLLSPNLGGMQEWKKREKTIKDIAQAIIRTLKTKYLFVIVDVSQDYNMPLVAAALDEATDVIIPIPPLRPAIQAVQRALPTALEVYGSHNKFSWFQSIWSDHVDPPPIKAISQALGIPQLAVKIPVDHDVADSAVNRCLPFVLWDNGPLGTNMKLLAGLFDQRAAEVARQNGRQTGLLKRVSGSFFKGA